MCISLSLAGLSSRVEFLPRSYKKAIRSQKIHSKIGLGLFSKFYRLLQGRVKVEWRQIEYYLQNRAGES